MSFCGIGGWTQPPVTLVKPYTDEWYSLMTFESIKRSLKPCPTCGAHLTLKMSEDGKLSTWCPEGACIYDESYSPKEFIERNSSGDGYLDVMGRYSLSHPPFALKVGDEVSKEDSGDDSGDYSFHRIIVAFSLGSFTLFCIAKWLVGYF